MKCFFCSGCGQCGKKFTTQIGECPVCQHINNPSTIDAERCEKCGFVFIPPPGFALAKGRTVKE